MMRIGVIAVMLGSMFLAAGNDHRKKIQLLAIAFLMILFGILTLYYG
jgi:hypothetical protein